MVSRKIEFHSNTICDGFLTVLRNRRVREWRVTLRYSLGCIYRFQFRDRLGSPQHFCTPCHPRRAENSSAFYLRKLLIISKYCTNDPLSVHTLGSIIDHRVIGT